MLTFLSFLPLTINNGTAWRFFFTWDRSKMNNLLNEIIKDIFSKWYYVIIENKFNVLSDIVPVIIIFCVTSTSSSAKKNRKKYVRKINLLKIQRSTRVLCTWLFIVAKKLKVNKEKSNNPILILREVKKVLLQCLFQQTWYNIGSLEKVRLSLKYSI